VALGLAGEIAINAPLALAASKRILQEQGDWSSAEMWEAQSAISDPVFGSQDAREGATAFAEKRPPVWRGR
jgi:enoyl-CoA hydratase